MYVFSVYLRGGNIKPRGGDCLPRELANITFISLESEFNIHFKGQGSVFSPQKLEFLLGMLIDES